MSKTLERQFCAIIFFVRFFSQQLLHIVVGESDGIRFVQLKDSFVLLPLVMTALKRTNLLLPLVGVGVQVQIYIHYLEGGSEDKLLHG